jgi:hypothetical protein
VARGAVSLDGVQASGELRFVTLAFNASSAPDAMKVIGRALGSDDPPGLLCDPQRSLGLATSLGSLGLAAGAL